MSLADAIGAMRDAVMPAAKLPPTIPGDVLPKLTRGRTAMLKDASKRRLCMRFRRNETYWYVDEKNFLNQQSTVTHANGSGKPPHRIRNRYDFLGPIIDAKVSAATSKVPSYEINPSTGDPQDRSRAQLASQVALYGYDQWRLRTATIKAVEYAIGGGGVGYALPYFDPNVGPYTEMPDGEWVGQGDIKVLILSGNQVYSEPGVDFDDSRWYAIERARPIDEVKDIEGYIPGTVLTADGKTSDIPTDREASDNLVMVTEFFERPCPKYPQGRCMTFANQRPIVDYRLTEAGAGSPDWWGPYPVMDGEGDIVDEPILLRLVYRHDADTDNDLGLTWRLIDFQRTVQDTYNKMMEYKNRGLNLQMLAPVGSLIQPPDDVPGAIRYYKLAPGMDPRSIQWEPAPDPAILNALEGILNRTVSDMRDVAFDVAFDVAPNVAAQTVGAATTQSENKWAMFLGDLAEWHSRLMRRCLMLCSRHYSEPRLLEIRGRWGAESIKDFIGSELPSQMSVRVTPDSLQSKSRAAIQQELAWIQANWPGYLSPEVAIGALHGGTAENLIQSYELDLGRVNGVIQAIIDGTVMDYPPREQQIPGPPGPDGMPGPPQTVTVGAYMPGEMDSLPIWKKAFGDFLKTDMAMNLSPPMQAVAQQVWSALKLQESQQAAQAQAQQMATAAQLGAQNAAAPQTKGVPSQPGVSAPAQQQP